MQSLSSFAIGLKHRKNGGKRESMATTLKLKGKKDKQNKITSELDISSIFFKRHPDINGSNISINVIIDLIKVYLVLNIFILGTYYNRRVNKFVLLTSDVFSLFSFFFSFCSTSDLSILYIANRLFYLFYLFFFFPLIRYIFLF